MRVCETSIYQQAFIKYLRKGTSPSIYLKNSLSKNPSTHYIWRTQGDGKVRLSHAENNGRIFTWEMRPPTGHPGEDYNCRCIAEPYFAGQTEYAYQIVITPLEDVKPSKDDLDLAYHFYFGGGRGLTLSEIGHLRGIVDFYLYTLGKYNSVNSQIIEEARKHPTGRFGYIFDNSYGFGNYLFSFGGGTISGVFTGTVERRGAYMRINGEVEYFYDDIFTDPLSIRELYSSARSPEDLLWIEKITDLGGSYFPVKDYWKSLFRAEAKIDSEQSIYFAE